MNEFKVKVDSLEMTQLEKDLYRLAMIEGRFYFLHIMLKQIPEDEKHGYSFKSLLREHAVIQLHNFLKIRDSIRGDLRQLGKENVDESLKPLWQPIHGQREAIKEFRNQYYAHIQEDKETQFNKTIEQILYDSKFSGLWNDILYYTGCAWHYSRLIQGNFESEWFTAQSKYTLTNITKDIGIIFQRDDIKHIQDVDLELKNSVNLAKENLKKNNLKCEGSSIEKVSFSYTEDLPERKTTPET